MCQQEVSIAELLSETLLEDALPFYALDPNRGVTAQHSKAITRLEGTSIPRTEVTTGGPSIFALRYAAL